MLEVCACIDNEPPMFQNVLPSLQLGNVYLFLEGKYVQLNVQ